MPPAWGLQPPSHVGPRPACLPACLPAWLDVSWVQGTAVELKESYLAAFNGLVPALLSEQDVERVRRPTVASLSACRTAPRCAAAVLAVPSTSPSPSPSPLPPPP